MTTNKAIDGLKERLDDFIRLAQSGQSIQLRIRPYRSFTKQVGRSESTDDIDVETDLCLFMADFKLIQGASEASRIVSKVYAISPINEKEVDEKTTRKIANERLKMDFVRLKEAKIRFEEKYF